MWCWRASPASRSMARLKRRVNSEISVKRGVSFSSGPRTRSPATFSRRPRVCGSIRLSKTPGASGHPDPRSPHARGVVRAMADQILECVFSYEKPVLSPPGLTVSSDVTGKVTSSYGPADLPLPPLVGPTTLDGGSGMEPPFSFSPIVRPRVLASKPFGFG